MREPYLSPELTRVASVDALTLGASGNPLVDICIGAGGATVTIGPAGGPSSTHRVAEGSRVALRSAAAGYVVLLLRREGRARLLPDGPA